MKYAFFLSCLMIMGQSTQAQQTPAKSTKAASTAAPVLSVRWGGKPTGNLTVKEVQALVDSPLLAIDEKGNRYPVQGFRINYTFKGSYKDEETGLTKTVKDFRAYDFDRTDRMNDLWKESVRDNVKKEDEILFNKILVRMKNGKSMLAKDLRFNVIQ